MQTSVKVFKDLQKFIRETAHNPERYKQNPQNFTMNFKKAVNTLNFYRMFVKFLKSFCYRTALNE